jgi:hypothetical protein
MDGIDSLDFSSNVFVDEVISFPATDGIPIRQMPRLMLDSSVILAVSQEAEREQMASWKIVSSKSIRSKR